MNEEQVIQQLDIVIRAKYKDALKDIDNAISSMKQKIQQTKNGLNFGSNDGLKSMKNQMNEYANSIGKTTARQEQLLRRINDIKSTLQMANGELGKNEITDLRAELEKLTQQYNRLGKETKEVKSNSNGLGTTFSQLWKKIKLGSLALLGARSVFALFRKGMQSAVSVNQELQSQQEITTNALGQLFVPAMKVAMNVVQYLIVGISELIRLFTGWDAISKVTSKSLSDTNKNAKALNKTLSSIDEIENLSDSDSSSLSSSYASDMKALNDLQEKVEKVRALFKDWGIEDKVKKIKSAYDKYIKPIFDFCLKHPEVISTVFGIFLTGKLLIGINKVIGNASLGTGLLGLNSLLVGLTAAVWTIEIGYQIYKEYKEIREQGSWLAGEENTKYILDTTKEAKNLEGINNMVNTIEINSSSINSTWGKLGYSLEEIRSIYKRIGGQSEIIADNTIEWFENSKGTEEEQQQMLKNLYKTRDQLEENLSELHEGTDEYNYQKKALDKIDDAIKKAKYEYMGMPTLAEKLNKKFQNTYSSIVNYILEPLKGVKKLFSAGFSTFLHLDTSGALQKLETLFNTLSKGFANSSVGKVISSLTTKGTVAKNSMLKLLEQAGVKFQAKGNVAYGTTLGITGEYQNVRSNPEITSPQNIMAETFSSVLASYLPYMNSGNSGDAVFYLNGKEFAKAVYNDMENESTRRGANMSIKVGV